MRFLSKTTSINFLGLSRRRAALAVSAVLVIVSLVSLATRGLDLGIDFTGGVLLEVGYPGPANLDSIRGNLADAGFEDAQVLQFGANTDVLVRLPPQAEGKNNSVSDSVCSSLPPAGTVMVLSPLIRMFTSPALTRWERA